MDQSPQEPNNLSDKVPTGMELRQARLAHKAAMKKQRQANMAKARLAMDEKKRHKAIVAEKVAAGMPITEGERDLIAWKPGRKNEAKHDSAKAERETIAAASKLLLKPQNIAELRHLVEHTARKHHYNPLEALICQAIGKDVRGGDLPPELILAEKDKMAIHKTLLPFLVPQLPPQKPTDAGAQSGGIKVVVARFSFDTSGKRPDKPIHEEAPITVETSVDTDDDA
jgi:hypothetical protein